MPLGGTLAEWVRTRTGTALVRPHYITFNASNTHAIISFVGTGHVLILNAATRTPVFVVDVGLQAHAAVPSADETYILVANQNGKLVQRIATNYATETFSLQAAATLDLATGTTPSGALFSTTKVSAKLTRTVSSPRNMTATSGSPIARPTQSSSWIPARISS